jgi:uncharacterized protein with PIN domain
MDDISDSEVMARAREALVRRDKRWAELDAAIPLEVLVELHSEQPCGKDKSELAAYITDRRRKLRADIVVEEVTGEHLQKAGRDIAIFGALAGVYAYLGLGDLTGWPHTALGLCAPLGLLFYLWALWKGTRMMSNARMKQIEIGPDL